MTGLIHDASGDTLAGIESVVGGELADRLTGDGLANRLDGGGDDTLMGMDASDRIATTRVQAPWGRMPTAMLAERLCKSPRSTGD